MRRRRRWIASLATAVIAASMAAAPSAQATPNPPIPQPVHAGFGYLALGDSVAFGYRPGAVTTPAQYADAANFVGYPEDLAAQRGLTLANASCAGETTASLNVDGAQSNGCENSVGSPIGYRDLFPLHVAYTGTQLDYAVGYLTSHPRTRLVTIDIGANDTFICQATTADHCTGADLLQTLQTITTNLSTTFAALRQQAHYHHDLVLLSYYSLNYADPVQVAGTLALNRALAAAAQRYGVIVADGYGAFAQASAAAGGDPCAAGLLIALPKGGCDVHPTALGHQVLAAAIDRALVGPAGR